MQPKTFLLAAAVSLSTFAAHAAEKSAQVDNSGINERDRGGNTLTPEAQSQSKSDIELAARVRRAVIGQDGVSMDGKNIKIIAMHNAVTLRGPVKDAAERAEIEKTVRAAAGSASIDNQLEIR
jgi:hyperosmotically inducible protein